MNRKPMNKKGFVITDLFIIGIIAIVVVLFFGVWIFGFDTLTTTMIGIESPPGGLVNISQAATDTFGNLNAGFAFLRTMSFLIIFGYSLALLMTSFLTRRNPGLGFVIFLFVTIISLIFAVYITNAYELILVNPILGPTLQSFTASTFILLHLPTWITVIGFIGMILMFSGIPKDRELGGDVF